VLTAGAGAHCWRWSSLLALELTAGAGAHCWRWSSLLALELTAGAGGLGYKTACAQDFSNTFPVHPTEDGMDTQVSS